MPGCSSCGHKYNPQNVNNSPQMNTVVQGRYRIHPAIRRRPLVTNAIPVPNPVDAIETPKEEKKD